MMKLQRQRYERKREEERLALDILESAGEDLPVIDANKIYEEYCRSVYIDMSRGRFKAACNRLNNKYCTLRQAMKGQEKNEKQNQG